MRISKRVLNAQLTFMDSAQTFHWQEQDGVYTAVCGGQTIALVPDECDWVIEGDEAFVRSYLDLDRNYADLLANACHLPQAEQAMRLLSGLRILRQDAWEALLAFLCSANNNVSRIRSLVLCLCRDYGTHILRDGREYCGLPNAKTLAKVSEGELREKKFGYRAAYIVKSARMVADGYPISDAAHLPYAQARELLMKLPGVGGKVADCTLLFGCGHNEAFPVDVWVERLLRSWCGINAKNREEAARMARERFGASAGILQQYLFHCARTGLIPLDEGTKERQ